jgi:hypothetical protein
VARAAVRAIDEAIAAAPRREEQVLARMTPPPESYLPGKSIAQTLEAVDVLTGEDRKRSFHRKIAARLAADLDALAREAKPATKATEFRTPVATGMGGGLPSGFGEGRTSSSVRSNNC